MSVEDLKDRLFTILNEKSVRWSEFTLTSGKKSDFYIDVRQTALSAEGGTLIGILMFDKIRKSGKDIRAVAGLTLGADPLVTAISVVSHYHAGNIRYQNNREIDALIVRKEPKGHGTGNYIEGLTNVPEGSTVAVVDDVATSGGSLLKTIERVEAAGLVVGMVLTVVNRREGAFEALIDRGYTLESLFTREDFELNK